MARIDLVMPKMGESIIEATILNWAKNVGDAVDEDETILEIATDKVDSEIPSPVNGKLVEVLYKENDVVAVGEVIAIIETDTEDAEPPPAPVAEQETQIPENGRGKSLEQEANIVEAAPEKTQIPLVVTGIKEVPRIGSGGRFYSPLVRNIATSENISLQELEQIPGSGAKGRVTKKDIIKYLGSRTGAKSEVKGVSTSPSIPVTAKASFEAGSEIIEMDRMRKLIADHMIKSKHTSAHVTSYVEVDVTDIVHWRNKHKGSFFEKYGQKITYTPIFIDAVIKAIKDFPMINISVEGTNLIVKHFINIGMATALPSGNLIVPVIKNADQYNLKGLTFQVNDLAQRARAGKLKPEEIQNGTFTLTNVGTFGNVMGTPIINQPQVAIMATGAIRKKPAVLETEYGDVIAVRQMMYLSLSYDHRVVDGFLGGSFLRRVADYLEAFDTEQVV